jgi:hypothetical protein
MTGREIGALATLLAVVATLAPADAYLLIDHQQRWVEVAYYEDPAAVGAELWLGGEGDTLYAHVPPENVAGKGGGDLCFGIQDNDLGHVHRARRAAPGCERADRAERSVPVRGCERGRDVHAGARG